MVCAEVTFNLDVIHGNPPPIYREDNVGTQNLRNMARVLIRVMRLTLGWLETCFLSLNNALAKDEVGNKPLGWRSIVFSDYWLF